MKPRNELTREQTAVLLGKISPMTSAEKRSKYGNKKVTLQTFFGEHTFDSKREAACFEQLAAERLFGDIQLLLCQVPFRLPGRTRYVADFLVFYRDGTFAVIDAKGFKTQTYRMKKRQVEEIYRLKIEEP